MASTATWASPARRLALLNELPLALSTAYNFPFPPPTGPLIEADNCTFDTTFRNTAPAGIVLWFNCTGPGNQQGPPDTGGLLIGGDFAVSGTSGSAACPSMTVTHAFNGIFTSPGSVDPVTGQTTWSIPSTITASAGDILVLSLMNLTDGGNSNIPIVATTWNGQSLGTYYFAGLSGATPNNPPSLWVQMLFPVVTGGSDQITLVWNGNPIDWAMVSIDVITVPGANISDSTTDNHLGSSSSSTSLLLDQGGGSPVGPECMAVYAVAAVDNTVSWTAGVSATVSLSHAGYTLLIGSSVTPSVTSVTVSANVADNWLATAWAYWSP